MITERETAGLIKVMVVKGRPVGVSIAGHQAGELANLWSLVIANKLKMTENRTEYGEKSIRKLNHRIDEIEDDIVRQKQKIMKISDELNETFNNMFE